MINLELKDSVKQNQSLSMFFVKCTNQNLGYSFKFHFCSEYGPLYLTEYQMIYGRTNVTKNPFYIYIYIYIYIYSFSQERLWLMIHIGNLSF